MKQIMKKTIAIIAVSSALLNFQQASATPILKFDDINAQGGIISYDGESGALVGTDIIFDTITTIGAPNNQGETLEIVNGRLSFTTGANITESINEWTFAGGGNFTLTGTMKDSLGNTISADTEIVSGYFDSIPAPRVTGSNLTFNFVGFGEDSKNTDLLNFYGIDPDSDFKFVNSELAMSIIEIGSNLSFEAEVNNADLINSAVKSGNSPVPSGINMFATISVVLCSFTLIRSRLLSADKR